MDGAVEARVLAPTGSGAFDGRRIVICRPLDQADGLAAALTARGAEVVVLPLIAIVPPDDGGRALSDALADLDAVDWIVVTSANGSAAVAAALGARPLGAARVAAVGRATADALGRPVHLVPDDQIAEGLVAAFPAGTGRVVVAQADGARSVVVDGLRALGWQVEAVTAYRTVPVGSLGQPAPSWTAARVAAQAADALVLTSGSIARSWVAAVGTVAPPVVVAIGPATAAGAAAAGLKVTHIAADHSRDGVVDALERAWTSGG
jgi:uroporphyrinogen-III synthase